MPSVIQTDQLKSADGNTTYLNSGTLSNLTFPEGHVIQTVFGSHLTADQSATSSGSYVATSLTVQITPIQANAKIFISTAIGSTHRDENANHGGGFFMIYNTTGSAFVAGSAWRLYSVVNGGSQSAQYSYESNNSWCVETLSGQQNTQQTYTLYVKSSEGDFYFMNGQSADSPSKMIAQELAV